ncbi:MAG: hypothetical protein JSS14_23235 [Proteobacteria bacterium]|nr:hypothetical protein [Pseudomonadota bacterium]
MIPTTQPNDGSHSVRGDYWHSRDGEEWALVERSIEGSPERRWHVYFFSVQHRVFEELDFEAAELAYLALAHRGFSRHKQRSHIVRLPKSRQAPPWLAQRDRSALIGPLLKRLLSRLEDAAFSEPSPLQLSTLKAAAIDEWRRGAWRIFDKLVLLIRAYSGRNEEIVRMAEERISKISIISRSLESMSINPSWLRPQVAQLTCNWPIENRVRVAGGGYRALGGGTVDLSVEFKPVSKLHLEPVLQMPVLHDANLPNEERWLARLQALEPRRPDLEPSKSYGRHIGWFQIRMPPLDAEHLVREMTFYANCFPAARHYLVTIAPCPLALREELEGGGIRVIELPD